MTIPAENTAKTPVSGRDPTQNFIERFADDSQWKINRDVPCFDEHDEEFEVSVPGPGGKPMKQKRVEKFGLAELQKHAENCNRMVASGNPPGITVGHTLDNAPEASQPETVGWGKNFRVRYSQNLGRHVIAYDEYIEPAKYADASTYRYRSVERWRSAQHFRPIALLRREPRRNLGVVIPNQASATRVRYAAKSFTITQDGRALDTVSRYSLEYAMPMPGEPAPPPMGAAPAPPPAAPPPAAAGMPPPVQNNAAPGAGPSSPPPAPGAPVPGASPMVPSEQDKQLFAALCASHPVLAQLMQQAAAPPAAPPPPMPDAGGLPPGGDMPPDAGGDMPPESEAGGDAPPDGEKKPDKNAAGGGMGMPSGSNTCLPSMNKDKQNMSADTSADLARYAAEVAELKRDNEQLRQQRAADNLRLLELEKGERLARYNADLKQMVHVEGFTLDIAGELEKYQDAAQDDWDEHKADIRKYAAANQRPIGGPVRIDGAPYPNMRGQEQRMTKDQMETAVNYAAENPGTSWDKAAKYAMNGAPVR